MSETPLEELVTEKAFAEILGAHSEMFYRLSSALLSCTDEDWDRGRFFQLISEADGVEALLDDYGARHNRTYAYLREVIASLRGFALAGFSIAHIERRLASYRTVLTPRETELANSSIRRARAFVQRALRDLLQASREEGLARGLSIVDDAYPDS